MTAEAATSLSDGVLAAATFCLALALPSGRAARCWRAFFFVLALSAAVAATWHGFDRFRTDAWWYPVSAASGAAAALFATACAATGRPLWRWPARAWPVAAAAGATVGLLVGGLPFYALSVFSGVCLLLGAVFVWGAPDARAKTWILTGIAVTLLGLTVQQAGTGEGLLGPNALFHWFQILANGSYWLGARRLPSAPP